jgi:hypothetical protein
MPVGTWGSTVLRRVTGIESFPIHFCFYIIGSCLLGLVMSRLIEFPVLRIRETLFPVAGGPSVQQPSDAVRVTPAYPPPRRREAQQVRDAA